MSEMRNIFLFVLFVMSLTISACGSDDDENGSNGSNGDMSEANPPSSDPAIPEQRGHFEVNWTGDDAFSLSAPSGTFMLVRGGDGAVHSVIDAQLPLQQAGGAISILWSADDEMTATGELTQYSTRLQYGLSGEFTLEPGTYEVAGSQTDDGSPWLLTNEPEFYLETSDPETIDRRTANQTDAVLTIEEVTDESVKGTLIITGNYLSSTEDNFRAAIAFNAYNAE